MRTRGAAECSFEKLAKKIADFLFSLVQASWRWVVGSVWHKYKENQIQAPQVPESHLGGSPRILGLLVVPSAAAQEGVKDIIIQPRSPLMATIPRFSPQCYLLKRFVALLSVHVCVHLCASEPG